MSFEMIEDRWLANTSYLIGLAIDRNRQQDIKRLIRSIAAQCRIQGTRLSIGVKANDGQDYVPFVHEILKTCEPGNPIEVLGAGKSSYDSIGASHNILASLAIEHGYQKYIGLKPSGLLHHEAIYRLTEKWQSCDEHSLVEMRLFPKEHPKAYVPATGETGWCVGACFSISPQTLKLLGGFDENLGLYFEDVDLSWRLRIAGHRCYTAAKALYFHDTNEKESAYFEQIERLKSGWRLGQKWKNQSFQLEMEDKLIKLGVGKPEVDLIEPPNHPAPFSDKEIAKICEFGHGFNFSFPRW